MALAAQVRGRTPAMEARTKGNSAATKDAEAHRRRPKSLPLISLIGADEKAIHEMSIGFAPCESLQQIDIKEVPTDPSPRGHGTNKRLEKVFICVTYPSGLQ